MAADLQIEAVEAGHVLGVDHRRIGGSGGDEQEGAEGGEKTSHRIAFRTAPNSSTASGVVAQEHISRTEPSRKR